MKSLKSQAPAQMLSDRGSDFSQLCRCCVYRAVKHCLTFPGHSSSTICGETESMSESMPEDSYPCCFAVIDLIWTHRPTVPHPSLHNGEGFDHEKRQVGSVPLITRWLKTIFTTWKEAASSTEPPQLEARW